MTQTLTRPTGHHPSSLEHEPTRLAPPDPVPLTTVPTPARTAAVSAFTPNPESFLDELCRDYTQEKTPPCRVCGAKLVRSEIPAGPGLVAFGCGNRPLDRAADPHGHQWHEHYGQSYWVRRRHGDHRVRALIREVRALRAQVAALQRFAFRRRAGWSLDAPDLRQILAADPQLRAALADALAATEHTTHHQPRGSKR